MRRLLASACLAVTVFAGTSFVAAQAANNGVGRSESGSTGQARACEVHAQNKGKSHARGLDCATTTTSSTSTTSTSTTTTTVTEMATLAGTFTRTADGGCQLDASGTGLQPGSEVFLNSPNFGTFPIGNVSQTGDFTFTGTDPTPCEEFAGSSLQGTTAQGAPIVSVIEHAYAPAGP